MDFSENIPEWKVFKVLITVKGSQEKKVLKICLPEDEGKTAVVFDKDETCGKRAQLVDQEKKKNEEYLENIKSNPYFPVRRRPQIEKIQQQENKNINQIPNNSNGFSFTS